jgi:hypothetical protein
MKNINITHDLESISNIIFVLVFNLIGVDSNLKQIFWQILNFRWVPVAEMNNIKTHNHCTIAIGDVYQISNHNFCTGFK